MEETFSINVSILNNYTEEEIEETLKQNSKRDLLESLLTWKQLAKNYERNYDELKLQNEQDKDD